MRLSGAYDWLVMLRDKTGRDAGRWPFRAAIGLLAGGPTLRIDAADISRASIRCLILRFGEQIVYFQLFKVLDQHALQTGDAPRYP